MGLDRISSSMGGPDLPALWQEIYLLGHSNDMLWDENGWKPELNFETDGPVKRYVRGSTRVLQDFGVLEFDLALKGPSVDALARTGIPMYFSGTMVAGNAWYVANLYHGNGGHPYVVPIKGPYFTPIP
jgi:hypothetical protein